MLELKPVELADKAWIDPIVQAENSRSADYNFGNIFLWDPTYHQMIGRIGGRCITQPRYRANRPFFAFPIGTGDLAPVILELRDYAAAHGFPFTMRGVTTDHREELERLFPGRFLFEEDRDYWDYIYLAEKLATHSGK